MIEWFEVVFGDDKALNAWQMSSRAFVIFLFTLLLIRISGRRSFGLRTPLDNIVLILLGSIISRAVVGVSPFVPTLTACLVISTMHRLFALWSIKSKTFDRICQGECIFLYREGKTDEAQLCRSLINEEDLKGAVRLKLNEDSFEHVDAMYMEKSGEISVVKK